MISFLHPFLWIAAAAAAVPILLHLIRRRELRQVTFPAIRYLRQAEQRHARRLRVRHLLLLAVRVLLVSLLAAAAAGPLIGRGDAADHRPTALAIVIDESLSSAQISGERRLLDYFVESVDLTLGLASPDDQLALFSSAGHGSPVAAQGAAAIREQLRNLEPSATSTDLPALIRRANAWLASAGGRRAHELHVLTDLQRISVGDGAPSDTAAPASGGRGVSVLVYAPDYEPQPNGAPGDPVAEVMPLNVGQPTTISVTTGWYGPDPPSDPVVLRLIVGDDVVAVTEAELGTPSLLRLPPQDSGWVQGYVEIDPSGMTADDRRYFSWLARPPARVAVLGDVGEFVTLAVDALERGGRLRAAAAAEAEVWIAGSGERLGDGLAGHRSVIIVPPTSGLDIPRLNLRLERAGVPWRYEPVDPATGRSRFADGAPLGMSGLEVRRHYRIVPAGLTGADTAIIQLQTGEPWLIRGTAPEGSAYLLLASALTPGSSALPVSAAMIPFIDAAVGDWARSGAIEPAMIHGSTPVRLPPRARMLRYPDGSSIPVEGGATFMARLPGNYAVSDGRAVIMAFSVNAPITEADFGRGDPDALEAALPAAEWRWIRQRDSSAWADSIFRSRRGRAAWKPVVALFILIAILEAGLAAAGLRREPGSGGASRRETLT